MEETVRTGRKLKNFNIQSGRKIKTGRKPQLLMKKKASFKEVKTLDWEETSEYQDSIS